MPANQNQLRWKLRWKVRWKVMQIDVLYYCYGHRLTSSLSYLDWLPTWHFLSGTWNFLSWFITQITFLILIDRYLLIMIYDPLHISYLDWQVISYLDLWPTWHFLSGTSNSPYLQMLLLLQLFLYIATFNLHPSN